MFRLLKWIMQNRGYGGNVDWEIRQWSHLRLFFKYQCPALDDQDARKMLNAGGCFLKLRRLFLFVPPLIPLDSKADPGSLGIHLDHSYMANNTLFDGYFLSTATDQNLSLWGRPRNLNRVIDDFFNGNWRRCPIHFEPASSVVPDVNFNYDTFARSLQSGSPFIM